MLKSLKNYFKNFYNVYLTGLSILVSLPVIAPLTLALGLTPISKAIYFIYSFFCHQFDYRSIHLFDYQFAWCARDTGIWIGIWLVALLLKLGKIKGIKWYWVLPFIVPMALDGGIQTIFTMFNVSSAGDLIGSPLYVSNNLVRFMTGAIFGIGVSLWLSPLVMSDSDKSISNNSVKTGKNNLKLKSAIFLILAMFPLYIALVGLWSFTSTKNDPIVPLDFAVKTPTEDFFARRENGICPTQDMNNFLNFECFFK